MASEHETVVAFCVEAKFLNGSDEWFTWSSCDIPLGRAREVAATLRKQGREARIVKATTTTTREVVGEKT